MPVYNGALTDLNMVYQFINGGPIKVLQVQILSDDRRPVLNGGGFLLCLIYLGQKRIQAFRLGKPLLFVFCVSTMNVLSLTAPLYLSS